MNVGFLESQDLRLGQGYYKINWNITVSIHQLFENGIRILSFVLRLFSMGYKQNLNVYTQRPPRQKNFCSFGYLIFIPYAVLKAGGNFLCPKFPFIAVLNCLRNGVWNTDARECLIIIIIVIITLSGKLHSINTVAYLTCNSEVRWHIGSILVGRTFLLENKTFFFHWFSQPRSNLFGPAEPQWVSHGRQMSDFD